MDSLNNEERFFEWLKRTLKDPLVEILSKNSNLTKIQLETLLIDILSEEITDSKLGYEKKSGMRISRQKITRGSFNRTLRQAKKNVISSIYTLLLLGYLGILDTPSLSSYIETSQKLQSYMNAYRRMWQELKEGEGVAEEQKSLLMMLKDLESDLELQSQLRKAIRDRDITTSQSFSDIETK